MYALPLALNSFRIRPVNRCHPYIRVMDGLTPIQGDWNSPLLLRSESVKMPLYGILNDITGLFGASQHNIGEGFTDAIRVPVNSS